MCAGARSLFKGQGLEAVDKVAARLKPVALGAAPGYQQPHPLSLRVQRDPGPEAELLGTDSAGTRRRRSGCNSASTNRWWPCGATAM